MTPISAKVVLFTLKSIFMIEITDTAPSDAIARNVQLTADLKQLILFHWCDAHEALSEADLSIDEKLWNYLSDPFQKMENTTAEIALASSLKLAKSEKAPNTTWVPAVALTLILEMRNQQVEIPETYPILRELWLIICGRVKGLPQTTSAALMRGFRDAETLNENMWEQEELFVSKTREEICAPLRKIAENAPDEMLIGISQADYGHRRDEHYQSLRKVIFEQDCIFNKTQYWCPHEVLTLTSHGLDHQQAFVSTAILLVSEIHGCGIGVDTIVYRWDDYADQYRSQEEPIKSIFLDGFRHFFERIDGWDIDRDMRKNGCKDAQLLSSLTFENVIG
jgi:hypothetical protein